MNSAKHRCLNCIMPPHILEKLLESKDPAIRQAALETMLSTARLRGERSLVGVMGVVSALGAGRRTVFDCQNGVVLSRAVVRRTEDGPESTDESVNRAFDGLGKTREFYKDVLDRDSIDDRGMRLDGYVHRGVNYNNAFWDGREMIFGDGDGEIFTDFTGSLDVIAHELTHGVTENASGLEYHIESGALNESISDVFGSLVKQWSLNQTADEADWLIGAEIFTPGIDADALRSMKAPGTAYDNALLGKDPQPDHIRKFVRLPDTEAGDFGGVHINSGIPNKAFFLAATNIGGRAWEAPGHIWYESLKASSPTTQFQDFANTTVMQARSLYGTPAEQAVADAWNQVGIRVAASSAVPSPNGHVRARAVAPRDDDALAALKKQIEVLSSQVKSLTKEVAATKARKPAAATR
ncbi:M4 family metallopeptidase [Paludisphaera rhizosphaerae]|uniref:M4 family metallopeptidase n=1 Tax=Paludisphaera rhizosphaerae TaxID=2711216 RepID=UPI0013EA102C|nr:M4 family metallopeptidase [Paludisphaera rhizosphaerae]